MELYDLRYQKADVLEAAHRHDVLEQLLALVELQVPQVLAVPAHALPRRRLDHAWLAAIRAGLAAARGRDAPAGRHLGHG